MYPTLVRLALLAALAVVAMSSAPRVARAQSSEEKPATPEIVPIPGWPDIDRLPQRALARRECFMAELRERRADGLTPAERRQIIATCLRAEREETAPRSSDALPIVPLE